MDKLAEQYQGQVKFLFVYSVEAHANGSLEPPIWDSKARTLCPAPREIAGSASTGKARRRDALLFQKRMGAQRAMLVDGFGRESVRDRFFSGYFNPLVVVGNDGRIIHLSKWTNAKTLEPYLETLLAQS